MSPHGLQLIISVSLRPHSKGPGRCAWWAYFRRISLQVGISAETGHPFNKDNSYLPECSNSNPGTRTYPQQPHCSHEVNLDPAIFTLLSVDLMLLLSSLPSGDSSPRIIPGTMQPPTIAHVPSPRPRRTAGTLHLNSTAMASPGLVPLANHPTSRLVVQPSRISNLSPSIIALAASLHTIQSHCCIPSSISTHQIQGAGFSDRTRTAGQLKQSAQRHQPVSVPPRKPDSGHWYHDNKG